MNVQKKIITTVASLLLTLLLFVGCSISNNSDSITTGEIGVLTDDFGAVLTELSIEEFEDCGFELGDSIDVEFDNGYKLEDIPYYNGYYAKSGTAIACGYPGYDYVVIAFAQGNSMWEESGAEDDTKIVVTLNEKGKYYSYFETFNMVYSNSRDDYDSDAEFANFRAIKGGNLKDNLFYRSASPVDNSYNRAEYACELLKANDIQYVMNLADSQEEVDGFHSEQDCNTAYYDELIAKGKVFLMDLDNNYFSNEFKTQIASALKMVCENDGTCLIHCMEGKDRTGFVSALILALADASYDEIVEDYMLTYENFYGFNKESDSDKYDAVVSVKADDMLYSIAGIDESESLESVSFVEGAKQYLRDGGLSEDDISMILAAIQS